MHYSISALSQTEKQLSVLAAVKIRATNCILIALNIKIPRGIYGRVQAQLKEFKVKGDPGILSSLIPENS